MQKVLAVGALVMVAGLAAAIPGVPNVSPNSDSIMYALIEKNAIEASGGDLSQLGYKIEYLPDGSELRTPIDGNEFLRVAKFMTSHFPEGKEIVTPDGGIGLGTREPAPAVARTGWPYCDVASLFTYFGGSVANVVQATASAALPVNSGPICGGFYGATQNWDVTIDVSSVSVQYLCGAAMVMIPTGGSIDIPVGAAGGYICSPFIGQNSISAGSAKGNGALYTYEFFGFGYVYFLGGGNVITVGSSA